MPAHVPTSIWHRVGFLLLLEHFFTHVYVHMYILYVPKGALGFGILRRRSSACEHKNVPWAGQKSCHTVICDMGGVVLNKLKHESWERDIDEASKVCRLG